MCEPIFQDAALELLFFIVVLALIHIVLSSCKHGNSNGTWIFFQDSDRPEGRFARL